jgi:hypothetical protein
MRRRPPAQRGEDDAAGYGEATALRIASSSESLPPVATAADTGRRAAAADLGVGRQPERRGATFEAGGTARAPTDVASVVAWGAVVGAGEGVGAGGGEATAAGTAVSAAFPSAGGDAGGGAGAPATTTGVAGPEVATADRRASVRPSVTPPVTATTSPITSDVSTTPRPPRRARPVGGATVREAGAMDATAGGTVSFDTLDGVGGRCNAGREGAGAEAMAGGGAVRSFGIVPASLARSRSSCRVLSRAPMMVPLRAGPC